MFLLTVIPSGSGSNNSQLRLLGTRDPNPSINGLMPGVHSATVVLCMLCVTLALLGVLFLLTKGVPLFSTLYATFNATKANNFKVGGSDVTNCDVCVR